MTRKLVALTLAAGVALTATGCAKKTIDPESTGSISVPGTDGTLQKFCDGPTLIYWNPGRSGEDDEYEFIVYSSEECTGSATPQPRVQNLPDGDE